MHFTPLSNRPGASMVNRLPGFSRRMWGLSGTVPEKGSRASRMSSAASSAACLATGTKR